MKPAERLRRLSAPAAHTEPPPSRTALRTAATALAGAAALVVVGVPWGLLVAPLAAYAAHRLGRNGEGRVALRARRAAAADLPFALDLTSACLAAGAPTSSAVRSVAAALPGPLAERLGRVAAALHDGAEAAEAWAPLGDLPGAGRLVPAAARSSVSGAALVGGLRRLAEELREAAAENAEAVAERGAVLVVLPLGLCFLPAFVLIGLVPVIVAVLGGVLPA